MWKLAMILGCVILSGCGRTSTTQAQSVNEVGQKFTSLMKANFGGHYQSACQETYFNGFHLYALYDETYTAPSAFHRVIHFYMDGACQVPFADAKQDANYQFFNYQDLGPESSGIAYSYTFSYFMPKSQQIATSLVSGAFCSRRDWRPGIWTDMRPSDAMEPQAVQIQNDSAASFTRSECLSPDQCLDVKLERITN